MSQWRLCAVETPEDVETMRRIRNSVRSFMTRDQAEISPEQQAVWWSAHSTTVQAFLLMWEETPAGYGLIRPTAEGDWLSGGVSARFRGKGGGRYLFTELRARCARPKLEVLASNTIARRLYEALGFQTVAAKREKTGDVLVMETR